MIFKAIPNKRQVSTRGGWAVVGGDYEGEFYSQPKPKWKTEVTVSFHKTKREAEQAVERHNRTHV